MMESYKHSCPFCGQHIEYTAEYCGRQMQCPSCNKTVAFPAIPPGKGRGAPAARVKTQEAKPAPSRQRYAPKALGFLRDFEHWNVVWQCAVPFLIIGALLAGATFVKRKFSDAPIPVAAPAVQADPEAWQKMTDLTKAEQAVQHLIKVCNVDHAMLLDAERARQQLEKADSFQRKSLDDQAQAAQNSFNAAHKRLDAAMQKYRELGGTVDYQSQLQNY
jgi:hypothetical protein